MGFSALELGSAKFESGSPEGLAAAERAEDQDAERQNIFREEER